MRQILKGSDEGVLANSIIPLFSMGMELFTDSIKLFCLDSLVTFHDACQSCLDILVEQGIADNKTWADKDPNLYESLYKPYYNKLMALEKEIRLRESELAIIEGVYGSDGDVTQHGVQSLIVNSKRRIQKFLDFQRFFGRDLWLEFLAYRRETGAKGGSYVSTGLNNAELFKNAQKYLEVVQRKTLQACTPSPTISATLRNLLVMPEFAPIVDKFSVGNWIRVRVDGVLYRVRLRSYTIHFNELDNIQIEFSNAMKSTDSGSNIHRTLVKARAMASNYSTVVKQAEKGEESKALLNTWVEKGLDATNTKIIGGVDNQTQTWDSHGMLFRKYDAVTDSYTDEQMKIINSTLAITDDNWETSKTAVGKIIYYDPENGVAKEGYGVNGEVLVGKLILGQSLGIYNAANTMKFTEDGLDIRNSENTNWLKVNPNDADNFFELSLNSGSSNMGFNKDGIHVSNERHEFTVNPNDECLMNIKSGDTDVLKFNEKGDLEITGRINATSGNVSMFNIDDDDEGLTAYFKDGIRIKQYGLCRNRFFAYLRDAFNRFMGHIDLYNGTGEDREDPYVSIGSVGDVDIISNSNIHLGGKLSYTPDGESSYTSHISINGNSGETTFSGATKFDGALYSSNVYNTTGGTANVYINSANRFTRATSASKYKLNIKPLEESSDYSYKILQLIPKQWFDKTSIENYAEVLTATYNGDELNPDIDSAIDTIDSCYGLIAEDVIDAGLSKYCTYNSDGEVEGIMYEKLWTLLIPIVKDLVEKDKEKDDKINMLEARIKELEQMMNI